LTDAVHADVLPWRNRPPERVYPVVFPDALRVKILHEGVVTNKAVYVALRREGDAGAVGEAD
jgi:transposase-like protein